MIVEQKKILDFVMPEKVQEESDPDQHRGIFYIEPLEPGFGVTIGNALRRVLLSSLHGYAITHLYIPGVSHEFSTIEGVREDVVEIVLNLKMLRLRPKLPNPDQKIFVSVRDKEVVTGKDIEDATASYEVINKDLVIAHLAPGTVFEMELTVQEGRGYRPSEENKYPNMPIGVIPIDSIFTPIKNVTFRVENTRVKGRTDYERLILDITTDGTITPKYALTEASSILIEHFNLFSDESIQIRRQVIESESPKEIEKDEEWYKMRQLLKTPLSELDISVRAYNCLKAADIKTLGDLVQYNVADLLKFRNFGKKSLSELEKIVSELGLSFGMDVSEYRLDEED